MNLLKLDMAGMPETPVFRRGRSVLQGPMTRCPLLLMIAPEPGAQSPEPRAQSTSSGNVAPARDHSSHISPCVSPACASTLSLVSAVAAPRPGLPTDMSSSIRVLIRDHPHRSIALATDSHVLVFRQTPSSADRSATDLYPGSGNVSQTSVSSGGVPGQPPRCMVEFSDKRSTDLSDYRTFSAQPVHGTLGLITVNNDVFLCVVSAASRAAMVRPGETVQKILAVDFRMSCTCTHPFCLDPC